MTLQQHLQETEISFISETAHFEGVFTLSHTARVHGSIQGTLKGTRGSTLIMGPTSSVRGEIEGDTVLVEGFVHGKIRGATRVKLGRLARVIGDIETPALEIETGAHFEGQAITHRSAPPIVEND